MTLLALPPARVARRMSFGASLAKPCRFAVTPPCAPSWGHQGCALALQCPRTPIVNGAHEIDSYSMPIPSMSLHKCKL